MRSRQINLNGKWVTQITWREAQRAFPIRPFVVLCPYDSEENRLPRQPRLVDQNSDWLFRCRECNMMFIYNPFIDKAAVTRQPETKPVPILPRPALVDLWDSAWAESMEI